MEIAGHRVLRTLGTLGAAMAATHRDAGLALGRPSTDGRLQESWRDASNSGKAWIINSRKQF